MALTGFLSAYDHLIEVNYGEAASVQFSPVPFFLIPLVETNDMAGRSHGSEFTAYWQASEQWRLTLGYAYTRTKLTREGSDLLNTTAAGGNTPRNSASISAAWTPDNKWQFSGLLRYVDHSSNLDIPAYLDFDFNLAWQPHPGLEVALTGQNLLHARHQEGKPGIIGPITELPRLVALRFTWKR
jgi:iron complex outermembrane receptor protein